MTHPRSLLPGLLLSGLLLAGLTSCGGGKASGGSWASWHKGAGFPAETREQGVFCKGAFRIDHKKQMGVDLIKRRRILPVYLELSEDGESGPSLIVRGDQMNPRLFLEDGTALAAVDQASVIEDVRKPDRDAVRQRVFETGNLKTGKKGGFLFFKLPSEKTFSVEGAKATHVVNKQKRKLRLDRSLLAFEISIDDQPVTMYVGVQ